MSNNDNETQTAETSQSRYNTRKRKLSEEKETHVKEVKVKQDHIDKSEHKKLKPVEDNNEEENGEEVLLNETDDKLEETKNGEPEEVEEIKDDLPSESEKRITRSRKSRKRKLSEEKEKDDEVKPETSRKRKERDEKEVEEVVVKRKHQDAILTVEDWRLQKVQSPIALKHEDSNEYDNFDPLEFHGHWDSEGDASFTNNGYTATVMFKNREAPFLLGGPLHEDIFVFEQLHFHWSSDDHSGCEHIFEGKAYSMEAHAVHYNSKYGSFKDAVDKHDGLAVVAFFLQATDDFENDCFKKLSEAVKEIVKINSTTDVRPDCLTWIKEGAQCKGYYTYQGSLTTEPYFESVTWIIYPKPIHISNQQVENFRAMKSTPCEQHNILNNVRPVQTPQKKLDIIYARSHRLSV
ncbi:carbonic anhydrase [Holotrichia oblita]|uniref:Carbonic anhydrase n=1 Tax=Holotrichia oblita TaxID=644536 RepID=A0ACB9SPV0_HOLOL|nr:carbonic anhydrase [Holotrichia oblita]